MTCSDFIEGFSDYVDGVGSSSLAEADGHLEDCDDCRRYLEVYERGRALLRSFPSVEVTDDFHPRLRHRIYHIEDGRAISSSTKGSATTAATAVGMALLLVLAAWSPVLVEREPVVDLSPIVVSRPAPSAMGLRTLPAGSLFERSAALSADADLWRGALLYRYSPLAERAGRPRVQRAGLD